MLIFHRKNILFYSIPYALHFQHITGTIFDSGYIFLLIASRLAGNNK